MLNIITIEARDLPDLWFQALYNILEKGRKFKIDSGSFTGEDRLEYDYFIGHVKFPGTRPLIPEIPQHLNIPAPVSEEYIFGGPGIERSYLDYLMTDLKADGEEYTYGSRLYFQIDEIIDKIKKYGHRNNQLILQVAEPTDIYLNDPPCLRHIQCRIQDNKLHFFVYFRSWDLYSGLPANLAGIQIMKELIANEVGVEDGEMIVNSGGLHIYGYAEELVKIRCYKNDRGPDKNS